MTTESSAPRPASTVCAVRQNGDRLEVLMVKRGPTAKFMANAWVFPGGVLDPEDSLAEAVALTGVDDALAPWVSAAARELCEETGIWVTTEGAWVASGFARALRNATVNEHLAASGRRWAGASFSWFTTWVTPTIVPMRFEARFFAVELPLGIDPDPDPEEIADAEWIHPRDAVKRAESGEWAVPFPTARTLETISRYESVSAWLGHIESLDQVDVIQPRMRILEDDSFEVLLPGDDGFDAVGDLSANPQALSRAASVALKSGDGSMVEVSNAS